MALIVEDGSGVLGANSYVSLQYVSDYCSDMGYSDWDTGDSPKQISSILRAMKYIECFNFIGVKNQIVNDLEWPRSEAYNRNGLLIDSDIIPSKVKSAVCEAAYIEFLNAGKLQPSIDRAGLKKEEYGDVKFEYFKTGKISPSFSVISGLLVGLVKSSSSLIRS